MAVTRYGDAVPFARIKVMEATHPVPVPAGLEATAAIFAAVQGLGPDDLVVAPWRACGPWARIRWHACGA